MAVQPGLCRTWSETPKTGFLTTRLISSLKLSIHVLVMTNGGYPIIINSKIINISPIKPNPFIVGTHLVEQLGNSDSWNMYPQTMIS